MSHSDPNDVLTNADVPAGANDPGGDRNTIPAAAEAQSVTPNSAPPSPQALGANANMRSASPRTGLSPSVPPVQQRWGLKKKATMWALVFSMVPVLAAGVAMYASSQSVQQQISPAQPETDSTSAHRDLVFQTQRQLLLIGTGAVALLAGALSAFWVRRVLHPALVAAATSTDLVNRLRHEESRPQGQASHRDELVILETNLKVISMRLPDLLLNQVIGAEPSHFLMDLARQLQSCDSQDEVLQTTVAKARAFLKADRISLFRYHNPQAGHMVAESVAPRLA